MAENNSRDHQVEQGREAMRFAADLLGQELVEGWKNTGIPLISWMTVKDQCGSIHQRVHVLTHREMAHGEWQKAAEPSIDELAENTSFAVALMGLHRSHGSQNYLGYSCEGAQLKSAGALRAEKAEHTNAVLVRRAVGELAEILVGHVVGVG
jgi:hypothetical protein